MVNLLTDDARAIAVALGCPLYAAHTMGRYELTAWLANKACNLKHPTQETS